MMSRHSGLLTAVVVAVILLGGGALALCRSPVGAAVFASRGHFIPSDANPAILYEPGMEREAKLVAAALPQAIATVEAGQYLPVAKPFNVYVCASQESFNRYMGAPAGATARGVKVLNDIFLSPATFSSWRGDTHASVLAHLHAITQPAASYDRMRPNLDVVAQPAGLDRRRGVDVAVLPSGANHLGDAPSVD